MNLAADLLLYLILVLAVGLGLQGGWLMLRSFGREATTLNRRLAATTQASEATPSGEVAQGSLSPWLNAHAPWIERSILAAGAPLSSGQLALGVIGLMAIVVVAGQLGGLPLWASGLCGGVAGLALPNLVLGGWTRARRKRFLAQMPQAVELIARSLQAGHPVTTAMAVAAQQMQAPLGPEFGKVLAEMSAGLDRDTALRNLLRRYPLAELQMFAASLEVTRETGGNVAEVLLNLADAIRAKAQLRRKVDASSAEGRLSFWVISALPVVVAASIMALTPGYYRNVASDPLFRPLMMVPPLLWLAGAAAIWRLVNFRI
jgi:tight adherence protein B